MSLQYSHLSLVQLQSRLFDPSIWCQSDRLDLLDLPIIGMDKIIHVVSEGELLRSLYFLWCRCDQSKDSVLGKNDPKTPKLARICVFLWKSCISRISNVLYFEGYSRWTFQWLRKLGVDRGVESWDAWSAMWKHTHSNCNNILLRQSIFGSGSAWMVC